jgi:hypothetical protein
MPRAVRVVYWLAAAVAACLLGTTLAIAPTYGYHYDVATIARVEVHEFDDAPASTARLEDVREGSVSPSVESRGTSTTPLARSVATNSFPSTADELTGRLGVDPVRSMTKDGTPRFRWEPNERTRITMESHPEGLRPGDVGFNPRHHGEHFHVQTRPTATTGWNNPAVTKVHPPGYTPGSGTGFLPGEAFPG